MELTPILGLLGACATVVGATWALRSKLSDIEMAIQGHIKTDAEQHKNHDTRIASLEDWRNRGRR